MNILLIAIGAILLYSISGAKTSTPASTIDGNGIIPGGVPVAAPTILTKTEEILPTGVTKVTPSIELIPQYDYSAIGNANIDLNALKAAAADINSAASQANIAAALDKLKSTSTFMEPLVTTINTPLPASIDKIAATNVQSVPAASNVPLKTKPVTVAPSTPVITSVDSISQLNQKLLIPRAL